MENAMQGVVSFVAGIADTIQFLLALLVVMQPMLQAIFARTGTGSGNERPQSPKEESTQPKKKRKCKWGRWADVIPGMIALPGRTELQSVPIEHEMDPALWGELHRYLDIEEMVIAKLPLHSFYQARSVCKKWNTLPWNRKFLEKWSKTSLPKPYFILYGDRGCHQAILILDLKLDKWVLKPLPSFGFQQPHTSVAHGLVYTGTFEGQIRGTVFNVHTKVFRRLPTLNSGWLSSNRALSILAVDKRSNSYKVLVAWGQGFTHVYDCLTDVWTRRTNPPKPVMNEEDSTHCEGIMYIKWKVSDRIRQPNGFRQLLRWRQSLFSYNFEHDLWSVLPLAPHGCAPMRGLGEWKGVLRDLTLDEEGVLRIWEFQPTDQVWIEVDRMPANVLEWFIEPYTLADFLNPLLPAKIKTSYCEQYMLMSHHGFSERSGLARFVHYDMELKSWETLHVAKDWICPCPFSSNQEAAHA